MILDILSDTTSAAEIVTTAVKWEENLRFLGIKIINVSDFSDLVLRFLFNVGVLWSVLQFIYIKNSKRKDFYFSYMAVGAIVFLLCFLLNSVKLELGFALGLFAIFGIIRYRTDAIPIKEMTYLFIIIGISVMNALSNKKVSYAELIFTNSIIVFGLYMLERYLKLKQEGSLKIVYENIANVHSDNHEVLMADLVAKTGIEITRFEIERIDYLKDIAIIIIYFHAGCNGFSQSNITQSNDSDYEI